MTKPILFNTDMVRAILDGRKTVTRRVVKPQPFAVEQPENAPCWCGHFISEDGKVLIDKLPYRPGDVLYVRETWANLLYQDGHTRYVYKASDTYPFGETMVLRFRWHPSIHMPREAARIFLRVTDVRVERLQDITEEQAIKEGCLAGCNEVTGGPWGVEDDPEAWTAVEHLGDVWDSTIKKAGRALYGWDANPWVWVIAFERISKEEAYGA